MPQNDDDDELRELQKEAFPLGLFVGQHKHWRDGPYFVAYLNEARDMSGGILKFATVERVRALLAEHAKSKMPIDETDDELLTLQFMARKRGFYVGEHQRFDPCRGGGQYFLMLAKSNPLYDASRTNPTILKYQTAAEIEDYLNKQR